MSNSACNCCDFLSNFYENWLQFSGVAVSCTGEYEEGVYRECDLPAFPAYPPFLIYASGLPDPELEPGQNRLDYVDFYVSEAMEGSYEEGHSKQDGKLQYRFAHPPILTCYLKVWIEIRTIPEEGEESVEIPEPYEWIGSGSPCWENSALPADAPENVIYSTPVEVLAPAANGRIQVTQLKYTFLEDYEPDISDPLNPQPSGFPDPLWEPLPP
jgi:hypothetical protein